MQKDADLVELERCCQTHIFLQISFWYSRERARSDAEPLYAAAALRSDYKPTREAKGANHPVAYSSALVLAKNDVMWGGAAGLHGLGTYVKIKYKIKLN